MKGPTRLGARRHRLFAPLLLVTLSTSLLGCNGSPKATARAASHRAAGTSTSTSTTRAPTTSSTSSTTSTTVPPPLPAPPPISPLVAPALPGEGRWRGAGDRLTRGFAIYTTVLRPAPGLPEAGIAWIDSRATRIGLYAGIGEPSGSWPEQSYVGAAPARSLMAAFNSGFKIYSYDTGWYADGRTAMPLQNGAASLVIHNDGVATVTDWGRDAVMARDVVAVRQNLSLLVDHGAATPQVQIPGDWGAVLGGGYVTWRSAVGVTAGGDLVYAGGPEMTPAQLAGLMVAARAERAMELDINPEWVSFATFTHAAGIGAGSPSGGNLVPGMYFAPDHYLQPYSRDFFAVFAR